MGIESNARFDWGGRNISYTADKLATPFISRILQDYEAAGILYCVLRSYEELPDHHGNDVDILVARKDLQRAVTLLADIAEELGWCKMAEVCRYGYNGLYFAPPNFNNRWLLVDLYTETHWRGLSYVSKDLILEYRIKYKYFHVASPGSEAALLLVKELLPWGRVKSRGNAKDRIRQCVENGQHDFVACLVPPFGTKTAELLLRLTGMNDWKTIEGRVKELRKKLVVRSLIRKPFRQLWCWIVFVLGHLRHRLRKPLGVFVVLLGPDGAGKTTIAKALGEEWQQIIPSVKEPEYIHGDFRLLPRLRIIREVWAKIQGRNLPPDPDYTQKHSGVKVVPHSLKKSLLYIAYYYWGYILGHYKIFSAKAKDRLIIADRYFYDYFFQRGNMNLPHWLLRFLSWFIPQPDLIVYLDRDAHDIYGKKDELTIVEIERQQEILRKLVGIFPNAVSVNGDNGIESTVRQIQHFIFSRMDEQKAKCI